MSQKIDELMACYDSQAQHFHHTRAFHKRPELSHIQELVDTYTITNKNNAPHDISLIDLWCGTWRIYQWIHDIYSWDQGKKSIIYTWVDLSRGMIDQCRSNYPNWNFIHQDMISYLWTLWQQSTDIILCLASFHHLTNLQDRLTFLHNAYRALEYWGKLVLVNRSFSDWFQNKYAPAIKSAYWKYIYTLGTSHKRDIFVPRIDGNTKQVYKRYYHIYTLAELEKLIAYTPFQIEKLTYIDQEWNLWDHVYDSRNSICILRK